MQFTHCRGSNMLALCLQKAWFCVCNTMQMDWNVSRWLCHTWALFALDIPSGMVPLEEGRKLEYSRCRYVHKKQSERARLLSQSNLGDSHSRFFIRSDVTEPSTYCDSTSFCLTPSTTGPGVVGEVRAYRRSVVTCHRWGYMGAILTTILYDYPAYDEVGRREARAKTHMKIHS